MQEGDIVYYVEWLEDDEMMLLSLKVNKTLSCGASECMLLNDSDVTFRIVSYLLFSTPVEAWCNALEELENIGFPDFVNDPQAISCVEWAEKAGELIPEGACHLHFEILDTSQRRITLS